MKLVIRGQRGTGKTALLHRLEGKPIKDEYSATPEIQTGHIHWNFKNSHDLVKVHLYMHSVPPQCKRHDKHAQYCVCVCVRAYAHRWRCGMWWTRPWQSPRNQRLVPAWMTTHLQVRRARACRSVLWLFVWLHHGWLRQQDCRRNQVGKTHSSKRAPTLWVLHAPPQCCP